MGFFPQEFQPEETTANFPEYLTGIDSIVKNHKFTDTKVVIGNDTFDCHMVVLKVYSEFFAKMSKNEVVDKETVILPEEEVTPIAFHMIYEWMLSDDGKVNRPHFAEVFKATKFLGIPELMNQIMSTVDSHEVIGEREALTIYLEAKAIDEKILQQLMMSRISKLFLTFSASWEYLNLLVEEVEGFLKSNNLGVSSELGVLFVTIRWLQHKWPLRKKQVPQLLKFVRFELIQSWQLVELKNYPKELAHIFKTPEVQEMIDKALSNISLGHSYIAGEGDEIPQVLQRRLVNDPLWNEFSFERNPNMAQNYRNFTQYLKKLDGFHWRTLKYINLQHESESI